MTAERLHVAVIAGSVHASRIAPMVVQPGRDPARPPRRLFDGNGVLTDRAAAAAAQKRLAQLAWGARALPSGWAEGVHDA